MYAVSIFSYSALALLFEQQEGHLACRNLRRQPPKVLFWGGLPQRDPTRRNSGIGDWLNKTCVCLCCALILLFYSPRSVCTAPCCSLFMVSSSTRLAYLFIICTGFQSHYRTQVCCNRYKLAALQFAHRCYRPVFWSIILQTCI